jgi:dihydroxyacetone kinase DhaKLM complex PTS-EIIA-like component DhaM
MSNSKTAIAEIKKLMKQFGFISDEPVLKSFKLEDNTILQTSDLKIGENISKINEAFEQVALEDGSYRLVENFNIEVKDGKIVLVESIFVNAKLVDGTEIKVEGDSLIEGAKVVVVTPDAEIPAPDGVHELEDGSKVETKDGVIVSVQEAMQQDGQGEPAPMGEPKAPVAEGPIEPQDELMSLLKEFIVKCSDKISAMETQMETMKNEFSSFKKEPAAKKIANGKTDFNKQTNNDDVDSRIANIMALRVNNK